VDVIPRVFSRKDATNVESLLFDNVLIVPVYACCGLIKCHAHKKKNGPPPRSSLFCAADLFGHGSCFGRVQILREHGLLKEEHVLQHALTDPEEARRARYPKGEIHGWALAVGVGFVLLVRLVREAVSSRRP